MKLNFETRKDDTRHKILHLLKIQGPQTVDELSNELEISSMGVRQHLVALESEGLIEHRTEKRGIGRPSYVYSLQEAGDELFPRRYTELALEMLRALEGLEGEEGINRVFSERARQQLDRYQRRMKGKDLSGRVRELARIRTEEGFMAEWEKRAPGTYLLREHNCALYQIALCCEQACVFEEKLFRDVLEGAQVTRERHILTGAQCCEYLVREKR